MKVHVLNHCRYDMVAHRVGCADVAKQIAKRETNSDWQVEVPTGKTIAEAVAEDISEGFGWTLDSDEEMPWRPEHIRVMPCCKEPKPKTAPKAQPEATMEFRLYTIPTKGGNDARHEIHTPSCKRTVALKKKGTYRKLGADTADAAAKLPTVPADSIIHDKCCKLFRQAATTNPPCPHCGNAHTVFASNIGVKKLGNREFACTQCKKMFVVNKPAKEKVMKIRISKSGKDVKKNLARKKKAAAREERKQARAARKAERQQKRETRMVARKERMFVRAEKFLERLAKMGVDTKALRNDLGVARQDAGLTKKARATKRGGRKAKK
jgi:hypothetical protein